jgi:hypothetical protein
LSYVRGACSPVAFWVNISRERNIGGQFRIFANRASAHGNPVSDGTNAPSANGIAPADIACVANFSTPKKLPNMKTSTLFLALAILPLSMVAADVTEWAINLYWFSQHIFR